MSLTIGVAKLAILEAVKLLGDNDDKEKAEKLLDNAVLILDILELNDDVSDVLAAAGDNLQEALGITEISSAELQKRLEGNRKKMDALREKYFNSINGET